MGKQLFFLNLRALVPLTGYVLYNRMGKQLFFLNLRALVPLTGYVQIYRLISEYRLIGRTQMVQ
jgi:hypothetical protein